MDRNAPITSKDVFPKRSARRLTEQENPKFLWSLQNAQRDTNNLAISRDFFGYSKLIFLFFVLYHFMLPENFYYGSEIRHGIFWGINFGPAIFLGFDFCPHSIITVTWNPEYPPGLELSWKGRWIFHTFYPKLIYIFLIGNCVGESNEKTKPS